MSVYLAAEEVGEVASRASNVTPTIWAITGIVVGFVILFDLFWAWYRRNVETSLKEASIWTFIYVSSAITFGITMRSWESPVASAEFFAGWITEYSLSVDNLFVFIIILSRLKVRKEQEQMVLLLGILMALVLRGIFIVIGAAVIERFIAVFFLFGAILLWTAYKLISGDPAEDEWDESKIIKILRTRGWSTFTLALIALGTTDILFALDSIPAIFGLTRDPYIVFMANAFALMGLRQLYFLVGFLLRRLIYLSKGLAIVLGFIGVKLVIEALHGIGIDEVFGAPVPHISLNFSLGVIISALAVTAAISLRKAPKESDPRDFESR
ncbi:MAG: TerC family protein [Actinobacteria bacterium]|nr:TerC family protein [Actinomycetota bacterium]MDA2984428.1 TerC family protein [Actinomycetota bacterium]